MPEQGVTVLDAQPGLGIPEGGFTAGPTYQSFFVKEQWLRILTAFVSSNTAPYISDIKFIVYNTCLTVILILILVGCLSEGVISTIENAYTAIELCLDRVVVRWAEGDT